MQRITRCCAYLANGKSEIVYLKTIVFWQMANLPRSIRILLLPLTEKIILLLINFISEERIRMTI